jgi:hypothetical protein
MIRRRTLLAGLAVAPFGPSPSRSAVTALPIPAGDRLSFHIIRKGSTIGEHIETFQLSGSALTVSVAVDIVIGLGPIAFFRYKHRATVQWEAGQVVSVDAKTNHDGTKRQMTGRRDNTGLVVQGTQTLQYIAPPHSLPGTHWNRAMLNAPFINTEGGQLMKPTVTPVGLEQVPVTGGTVQAMRYTLRGDADLDTFYDLTPSWVGLTFTAKDGSAIRYLRA